VSWQRSRPPILEFEGNVPPASAGWSVVALAKVYKDLIPAGVFVELTIRRDGSSVLTYEQIRNI
jgi:hypothetical protein